MDHSINEMIEKIPKSRCQLPKFLETLRENALPSSCEIWKDFKPNSTSPCPVFQNNDEALIFRILMHFQSNYSTANQIPPIKVFQPPTGKNLIMWKDRDAELLCKLQPLKSPPLPPYATLLPPCAPTMHPGLHAIHSGNWTPTPAAARGKAPPLGAMSSTADVKVTSRWWSCPGVVQPVETTVPSRNLLPPLTLRNPMRAFWWLYAIRSLWVYLLLEFSSLRVVY